MDRQDRRRQLTHLFNKQDGRCHVCGEPATLDGLGGQTNRPDSAVRFRTGSSFGAKGRSRPRVMAHRKCADQRAKEIELSVPIEELWMRSGSEPTTFYEAKKGENQGGTRT